VSDRKEEVSNPGRRAFLTGAWLHRRSVPAGPDGTAARGPESVVLHATRCVAWKNTICLSCRDVCPEDAILFDFRGRPTIERDLCTDCGQCLEPCPTDAFVMTRRL